MRGMIAYIACFIGVIGHASSEFVAKIADTPGPEFSVWRFMIGGTLLLVLTQVWPGARDIWTPLKRDWFRIIFHSAVVMSFSQLIFHWALDFTSVVQVATMVTAIPIFYVITDRIVNGTPMTRPKMVSGIGAFIGVVLLLTNGFQTDLKFGGSDLTGTLMSLACGITGGVYLVLSRPLVVEYGPVRLTAYTFFIGFFILWVVVGLGWGIWVNPASLADKTPQQIQGILTIGVWNTCIAMAIWLWGLSAAPDPQRANYMFFLKPVIAALFAVVLLGDPLTLFQGLAIFAICFCVALEYVWTQHRARKAAAAA